MDARAFLNGRTELARSLTEKKHAAQRKGIAIEPFWRTAPKVREEGKLGKTLA